MPILAFLAPLINWIFRGVVIKFIIFTALFAVMAVVVPIVAHYLLPFISPSTLSGAFSGLGAGTWFFLDAFQLAFGVPLMIAAFVTRFLIRRMPLIG